MPPRGSACAASVSGASSRTSEQSSQADVQVNFPVSEMGFRPSTSSYVSEGSKQGKRSRRSRSEQPLMEHLTLGFDDLLSCEMTPLCDHDALQDACAVHEGRRVRPLLLAGLATLLLSGFSVAGVLVLRSWWTQRCPLREHRGVHNVCSATAPAPNLREADSNVSAASWQLSTKDLQACRERNQEQFWWQFPEGRNWCWIGLKAKCHALVKTPRPWSEVHDLAAHAGMVPPRQGAFSPMRGPDLCDRADLGVARSWTLEERFKAREWFESHVAVYVLSFPDDQQGRWKAISERLSSIGVCFQRIDGVDLRPPGSLREARDAGWVPSTFNVSRAQEIAYSEKHQMGAILGTLGSAAAHFKAIGGAGSSAAPLTVVFEDDALPSEDFVERLWSLVSTELPCDWDVVSLSSWCPFGRCTSPHLMRVEPDSNEPEWRCQQGVNWGLQGMLYRTVSLPKLLERWQSTVFDEERPHCLNMDTALASLSNDFAYYAVPAVQDPGFLKEGDFASVRFRINAAAAAGEYALDPLEDPLPLPVHT